MGFNEDWLNSLKIGDRVAVMQPSHHTDRRYRFYTVKSISAKRTKFVIEAKVAGDTLTLNKYGYYDTGTYSHSYRIEPVTDAIIALNKRANAISKILGIAAIRREHLSALKDDELLEMSDLVEKILSVVKVN